MNLPDYIKAKGVPECAALFGVSESTIKSWRWRARTPRPEVANRIVSMTGGEVSLAEIYSPAPSKSEAA